MYWFVAKINTIHLNFKIDIAQKTFSFEFLVKRIKVVIVTEKSVWFLFQRQLYMNVELISL